MQFQFRAVLKQAGDGGQVDGQQRVLPPTPFGLGVASTIAAAHFGPDSIHAIGPPFSSVPVSYLSSACRAAGTGGRVLRQSFGGVVLMFFDLLLLIGF